MSDKMREEFEAWWLVQSVGNESILLSAAKQLAWQAWQASRAAVVVELPYAAFFQDVEDSPVLCYRCAEIEKRLDEAGVIYK